MFYRIVFFKISFAPILNNIFGSDSWIRIIPRGAIYRQPTQFGAHLSPYPPSRSLMSVKGPSPPKGAMWDGVRWRPSTRDDKKINIPASFSCFRMMGAAARIGSPSGGTQSPGPRWHLETHKLAWFHIFLKKNIINNNTRPFRPPSVTAPSPLAVVSSQQQQQQFEQQQVQQQQVVNGVQQVQQVQQQQMTSASASTFQVTSFFIKQKKSNFLETDCHTKTTFFSCKSCHQTRSCQCTELNHYTGFLNKENNFFGIIFRPAPPHLPPQCRWFQEEWEEEEEEEGRQCPPSSSYRWENWHQNFVSHI